MQVYAKNRGKSFFFDTVKCKTALEAVMKTIDKVEAESCNICDLFASDRFFTVAAYRYADTWDVHIWTDGGNGLLIATVKNG